jgi:hypothetical protein
MLNAYCRPAAEVRRHLTADIQMAASIIDLSDSYFSQLRLCAISHRLRHALGMTIPGVKDNDDFAHGFSPV